MYGHIQNLEFRMTSSNGVMVGRFLVFPWIKETMGGYWNLSHTVAIEEYYPCIPGTYQRGKDRYVCLAGQSLHCESEEWIEINWSTCCDDSDYIPHHNGSTQICRKCGRVFARVDDHRCQNPSHICHRLGMPCMDTHTVTPTHTSHSVKPL